MGRSAEIDSIGVKWLVFFSAILSDVYNLT